MEPGKRNVTSQDRIFFNLTVSDDIERDYLVVDVEKNGKKIIDNREISTWRDDNTIEHAIDKILMLYDLTRSAEVIPVEEIEKELLISVAKILEIFARKFHYYKRR